MAEVCGRQRWRQNGRIEARWGRRRGADTSRGDTLPLKTSCLRCPPLRIPLSLQLLSPQRRLSLGLLRLRERRPPPVLVEGRLGRWLLSLFLSPSLSRPRSLSLSLSPSAPRPDAPPLAPTLPSFSRPFSLSFFSCSRFLSSSSFCSLCLRSRSFCRSVRSKSLCVA